MTQWTLPFWPDPTLGWPSQSCTAGGSHSILNACLWMQTLWWVFPSSCSALQPRSELNDWFELNRFNPSALQVLQNIDDLFEREELSAASDIGWPDCFNSGVFVFKPSEETYAGLLQFALSRGSFDGEEIMGIFLNSPLHCF